MQVICGFCLLDLKKLCEKINISRICLCAHFKGLLKKKEIILFLYLAAWVLVGAQGIYLALYSVCQQIWKTQQWPQEWGRSVFIPIPKKGNAKECSNYCTIAFISHASKVMLKILQARLQHEP